MSFRVSPFGRFFSQTLLVWEYSGGDEHSAEVSRRGEQRAFSGDTFVSDTLGHGNCVRLDGADITIEFSEGDQLTERSCPTGEVYALASRERPHAACAYHWPRADQRHLLAAGDALPGGQYEYSKHRSEAYTPTPTATE